MRTSASSSSADSQSEISWHDTTSLAALVALAIWPRMPASCAGVSASDMTAWTSPPPPRPPEGAAAAGAAPSAAAAAAAAGSATRGGGSCVASSPPRCVPCRLCSATSPPREPLEPHPPPPAASRAPRLPAVTRIAARRSERRRAARAAPQRASRRRATQLMYVCMSRERRELPSVVRPRLRAERECQGCRARASALVFCTVRPRHAAPRRWAAAPMRAPAAALLPLLLAACAGALAQRGSPSAGLADAADFAALSPAQVRARPSRAPCAAPSPYTPMHAP